MDVKNTSVIEIAYDSGMERQRYENEKKGYTKNNQRPVNIAV